MASTQAIIVFLGLAFIALIVVSYINASQTRKRLISQRLVQLKRKVNEMEELAQSLSVLTGNVVIERIILEEMIDTLNGMAQLEPNSQAIELQKSNALQRVAKISEPGVAVAFDRMMDSDSSIARAQYNLSEAGRIIRKRQTAGNIEISEMNSHIAELAWANMMVVVVSLIGQGHKAVRRGDVLKGYAYYKKAQQAAMESTISDDRRHAIIKELGEILSNKRKSLSSSLMAETYLNPDAQSVSKASVKDTLGVVNEKDDTDL